MQRNLKWQTVDSSHVQQIAYDKTSEVLAIRYKGNTLYSYDGVDEEVFTTLAASESIGNYLKEAIKGSYPYLKHSSEDELEAYVKTKIS